MSAGHFSRRDLPKVSRRRSDPVGLTTEDEPSSSSLTLRYGGEPKSPQVKLLFRSSNPI